MPRSLFKDETLAALAETGNVAQFASFAPDAADRVRHGRILDDRLEGLAATPGDVARRLLAAAPDGTLNIRTFRPEAPDGNPFEFGLSDAEAIAAKAAAYLADGYHVILNETVDLADGGVSGVLGGGIVEFAPGVTPRAVEDKAVASLPAAMGLEMLETVYGFATGLDPADGRRIEFSLHPKRRGFRREPVILWQAEDRVAGSAEPRLAWPNDFSRFLGDKAYGLLMAHLLGAPVPRTTVIGRRVAPFVFGRDTGEPAVWTRPCPAVQRPGYFTTVHGWTDPFALVAREDTDAEIASMLAQQGVAARWAGSSRTDADGRFEAEGVEGGGAHYMDGSLTPAALPDGVAADLRALFDRLSATLGPVSFEWVHDGETAWVVQLHRRQSTGAGRVIVAGEAVRWTEIDAGLALESFRAACAALDPAMDGVLVRGPMGVTSHKAHILESLGLPARFAD